LSRLTSGRRSVWGCDLLLGGFERVVGGAAAAGEQNGDGAEEDDQAGPVVESQTQEVVSVIDSKRLDPGPADGVGRDVEGEQPAPAQHEPAGDPPAEQAEGLSQALVELKQNDRLAGGLTAAWADRAAELYTAFVKGTIMRTDATTAEMVKVMENTFRDVNVALAINGGPGLNPSAMVLAAEPLARVDYAEFVDPKTFRDPGTLAVVAVRVGRTRLIDNHDLSTPFPIRSPE